MPGHVAPHWSDQWPQETLATVPQLCPQESHQAEAAVTTFYMNEDMAITWSAKNSLSTSVSLSRGQFHLAPHH